MPDEITTTLGDCNSCNTQTYDFEGHPIRLRWLDDGQQGWVVRDLAAALNINHRTLLRRVKQYPAAERGVAKMATAGGRQDLTVVTGEGLLRTLMRTSSPRAERFRQMMATAGSSIVETGQYRAPDLPPQQNPSTAIAPATPSLEAMAQTMETMLGTIRQVQQVRAEMQQMRSDVQRELTSYIDHAIDQRSQGLREEMDGLRKNYSIVRDLVDEAGVERLIESVVGQMIEHQVHRQTAELRHTIGDLMEDVGVLQQRTEPPPGLSVLDQVRHVVDHYCRSTRSSHRDVYGCLYKQFTSRHHTDLPRRSKMAGARSVLEFVAERDKDERIATMLLSLAHDLFGFAPLVPRLPSDEDFERYRADCEMTDRIASEIEGGTWH